MARTTGEASETASEWLMPTPAGGSGRHATVSPLRPGTRLDALTSMRIFPALYVLSFHYETIFFRGAREPTFLSLGYSGVTFFFVLSGFILSHTYASSDFADRRVRGRYFVARLARIYPVFLLSIAVSLPFYLMAVFPFQSELAAPVALVRIVLTAVGLHAWLPGAACALNCPSWSISTEFFFYALFPFLFPLIARRPVVWCVGTVIVLFASWSLCSLVWSLFGHGLALTGRAAHEGVTTNLVSQFLMYWPPLRLPEFVGGILLYVAFQRYGGRGSLALIALACYSGLAILALQPALPDVVLHNGLTAAVWAPLILASASLRRCPLSWPPVMFLGRISYALYLLHNPAAEMVLYADRAWFNGSIAAGPWKAALGTTALALLLSAATYIFVEEPARNAIKRRWARPSPVLRVVPAGLT